MRPFAGFLDDAALFPPGDVPLADAVPAYRAHRAAWYAELVGPFVIPAGRVGELPELPPGSPTISLNATFPKGPDTLRAFLEATGEPRGFSVDTVEVALPDEVHVDRLLDVLVTELAASRTVAYVEVPRDERRDTVLDALAGTPFRAKFRTGGLVPEAHPSEDELAATIHAAVTRGVPFKCTAGLHHAVRHTDGELEQHGFLNVLLATDAALNGAAPEELAALLADRSPSPGPDAGRLAAARRSFLSFGTCSVTDPVEDLLALGLITRNGLR